MEYKFSKYLIHKRKKNIEIYYNFLIRNYVEINSDAIKNIEKNHSNIDFLIDEGILVKKDFNEKFLYKYIMNKIKYTNNTLSITDVVTLNCNLQCSYCMQQNTYKTGYQKPQNLEKRIELWKSLYALFKSKNIVVTFFGGEPSLYPQYIKSMVEKSEYLNLPIKNFNLISNGVFYSKDMFEVLNKIKFVQITLDGPEEIHNSRRKSEKYNNTWNYTINTIKNILRETSTIIVLHSVIDNANFSKTHMEMIKNLIEIFGIETLKERFIFNIGLLSHPDGFSLYTLKNIPPLKVYGQMYIETLKNILTNGLNVVDFLNVWPCTYNKESDIIIAPNGDLYNCISGIGIEEFKICSYNEFINNPERFLQKYSQMLENHIADKICEDCKYLPICNGGCRYNVYVNKTKKDCWKAFHDTVYEEILELYYKYKNQVII
ncbi:radical SAM/SPASM domain-containing protein [Marinitoga litoralis]|jgi:uncharacterized protein|uniref:radical SAM/SPASM domain-containing protein n=1 Tax=Marinitoga litoralis TaxID=570855 RepID=UPI001960BFE6|nr:radical SAM protein [Marinitoga litoralis]MBM7560407.1 uncharacterized protein [Marinitoga litoralis]